MVKQELWGYLLAHYAISALICTAATTPSPTRAMIVCSPAPPTSRRPATDA